MIPVSDIFLSTQELKSSNVVPEYGEQKTTKSKDTFIQRVPRYELELAYIKDAIIFNSINKIVQTIMSGDYKIVAKNIKIQNYFREFTSNLGSKGKGLSWEQLLEQIYKNALTHGPSFVENIFNKKHNRVVDWDILDPKKIDYAKDSENNIVIDDNNDPIGYFQLLNFSSTSLSGTLKIEQNAKKKLPMTVSRPMNYPDSIFLEKEKVAQIKFLTIGDGFYPIGLIEPIYKTTIQKMNIEESYASCVYKYANPILRAKIGDQNHQPTPNLITSTLNNLKNLNGKTELAVPYYFDIDYLKTQNIEKIRENLDYFIEQQIAGLGVTKTIATGSTEGSSESSLGNQSTIFSLTLKQIIKSITSSIEKEMFSVVCKYENFDEIPKLVWDIDTGDELNDMATRIMKYAQAGVLTYSKDVENIIRQKEGLSKQQ